MGKQGVTMSDMEAIERLAVLYSAGLLTIAALVVLSGAAWVVERVMRVRR